MTDVSTAAHGPGPATVSRLSGKAPGTFSNGISRRAEVLLGVAGIVGLIVIWEVVTRFGLVSARVLPPPSDVLASALDMLATGEFWFATGATVWVTIVGMAIIVLIAVPLAIAIHASRFVDQSTWFIIEFLKPIPGVALIPLTLLLWGPNDKVKLFLIVFGALWPVLTQLVYGLREVSGVALDMGRVYRLGMLQRMRWLTIPSMMPFALTGLRISITIALIIAVVTEYLVGLPGLGAMLALAQLNGSMDQAYALLFFAGILGLGFSGAVAALSGPLLFWHPSIREKKGT